MLRDFQVDLKRDIYAAWQDPTVRNVMAVSPTGSGKTVIIGSILQELNWPSCALAHRQELVGQIALAMNREKVPHGIIAPTPIIRQIVAMQMETHGETHYSPRAPMRVAGVDTLANHDKTDRWLQQVQLVVQDEGHHVLADNKWGKAQGMFPNARGLFPTAHAVRADGAGLGRHADGLVDRLVIGPACRELIDRGFLTDYRLICASSDVDISDVPVSPTGDFSSPKLRVAVHKSKTLVGDVVGHYLRFAAGKLGITFAVDIEAATELANEYRARGVAAEIITAKTPVNIRAQLMRRFRRREILQLVSVDVLGEGVDVPAIEVVSFARHTMSWQLFCQQFGRVLRIMVSPELNARWDSFTDDQRLALIAASSKPKAIIIDHVGNVLRHYALRGLPDSPQSYSLDRRERGARKSAIDAIPLRTCLNEQCLLPFERTLAACPNCGLRPIPAGRSAPELVDGDLIELDPATLAALRGDIARVDGAPRIPPGASDIAAASIKKNHRERQDAQASLRNTIAVWAGWQRHLQRADSEAYRRFYHQFGTDVASAQALGRGEAQKLEGAILLELFNNNVTGAT